MMYREIKVKSLPVIYIRSRYHYFNTISLLLFSPALIMAVVKILDNLKVI